MDEQVQYQLASRRGDKSPEAVQDDFRTPPEFAREEVEEVTPAAPAQTTSGTRTLQSVTDKALHFLANASNETLGACLVGLGATTYLVLGRVGLVIIGVAGGVVLHATWEGIRGDDRDEATKKAEQAQKREAGIEVAKRILEWRSNRPSESRPAEDARVYASQPLSYSAFEPETEKALNTFTDAVIKDYVHYWYSPQIPGEETFPATCRRTFTAFTLSLSNHLSRKRPADALLEFVTNTSSILIVFLHELAAALNACPHSTPEEAIRFYLELKPDSTLAYMLDGRSQKSKLSDAAEDILQAYLDPKAYNFPPVHAFLKEVLAQLVLGSTVTLCSRPEWINEWIVYGLEESNTVGEVMAVVDAGVGGTAVEQASAKEEAAVVKAVEERESLGVQSVIDGKSETEHRWQMSRAEDAMDEAMLEAKRLTQMMIEEDERQAREEAGKTQISTTSSTEDVSDTANTQGAPTPTSSQSDHDRHEDESRTSISSQTLSTLESPMSERPATPTKQQQFTSFDQLIRPTQVTALASSSEDSITPAAPGRLTLVNAHVSIFDDSMPNEKQTSIKQKPMADYLIQIEPANHNFPGWMIARKYQDFETLHEVLRRISVITGVKAFTDTHTELPRWRVHTKISLRQELERYLTDAVRYTQLAESEGMKRFLEKDQGLQGMSQSGGKGTFGWPAPDAFGKLGGDMMNVLTKAPKQVAGGGKAVFGGVTSFVGGVGSAVGGKKQDHPSRTSTAGSMGELGHTKGRASTASLGGYAGSNSGISRQSQDSLRTFPAPTRPGLDRHASSGSFASTSDLKPPPSGSTPRSSFDATAQDDAFQRAMDGPTTTSKAASPIKDRIEEVVHLPPPPEEMPEDYGPSSGKASLERGSGETFSSIPSETQMDGNAPSRFSKPVTKLKEPLTDSETSVTVELMFAVITELYTLSSAWNFRRTLLTAAKTFLLRPNTSVGGNPQLQAIRSLLQTSLLDSNLSDSGMASQIHKLRENGLPTEAEMDAWRRDYPEKNDEEKEELRIKARKLLVTKGMPTALQSVMGAAASSEALGKVFDCLQVDHVARGLIFGVMVQALRVVTH